MTCRPNAECLPQRSATRLFEGRLLAPPRAPPSRSAMAALFLGGLRGRRLRPRGYYVCSAAPRRPRVPARPRPSRLAALMAMLARRVWLARGPGSAGGRLRPSGGPSPSFGPRVRSRHPPRRRAPPPLSSRASRLRRPLPGRRWGPGAPGVRRAPYWGPLLAPRGRGAPPCGGARPSPGALGGPPSSLVVARLARGVGVVKLSPVSVVRCSGFGSRVLSGPLKGTGPHPKPPPWLSVPLRPLTPRRGAAQRLRPQVLGLGDEVTD